MELADYTKIQTRRAYARISSIPVKMSISQIKKVTIDSPTYKLESKTVNLSFLLKLIITEKSNLSAKIIEEYTVKTGSKIGQNCRSYRKRVYSGSFGQILIDSGSFLC